jgi:hypothetical protein
MKRWHFALATAFAVFGLVATGAPAAAVHVVVPGGSIQATVDRAAPGDTILVAPGTYREHVLVTKDGIRLVGLAAQIRPPAEPVPSPCADPAHPEESIGVCVFGEFFAGRYTSRVTVAGFSIGGFESGLAAVGAADSTFAWNRAVDNASFGLVGVFSPRLHLLGNDVRGGAVAGIFMLEQHDGALVEWNRVVGGATGILVQASDGVRVRANRLFDNALDLFWDGAGAGNVFVGNLCRTSDPAGLCN